MKKFIITMLCMLMLAVPTLALELDTAEPDAKDASLQEITEPLVDKNYGKLILFKDFEQENADYNSFAYLDTDYMTDSTASFAAVTAKSVVDDPKGEKGKVLSVTGTGWVQTFIDFKNFKAVPGKYKMVYDYYSETNATSLMERYFTNIQHSGGTGAGDYISVTPGGAPINKNAWLTKVYNNTLVVENLADGTGVNMTYGNVATKPYYHTTDKEVSIIRAGVMPNASSITYYLDNIKLYYFPENAIVFANGENTKMVEYDAEKITLPMPSAVDSTWSDTNFKFWVADGAYYEAGKEYDADEVLGKSLELLAFAEPLHDEEKGYLVVLFNYENADSLYDYTYINNEYFLEGTTLTMRTDALGSAFGVKTDENGNGVAWIKFSNKGVYLFGYNWNKGFAPAAEKVTLDFDYKIKSGEEAFAGKTFWTRFVSTNSSENYTTGPNVSHSGERDVWYDVSTSKTITSGTRTFGAIPQVNTVPVAVEAEVYYDNIAIYVKPAEFSFKTSKDGEIVDTIVMKGEEIEYTFPNPEDLGISSENFIAWTDGQGHIYSAGETAAFTNVSHFRGSEFYPFSQAADMPAVLSLFEGDEVIDVAKDSYSLAIEDDGRDVLYTHYWGSTWDNDQNEWTRDPRTYMFPAERFDASEYCTIEIMTKSTWAKDVKNDKDKDTTELKDKSVYGVRVYNCINENHSYTAQSLIVNKENLPIGNTYNLVTVNAASMDAWKNTGWGFVVDINNASYGADTYTDYIRVYRNGMTTVTYDTNAPEGAEVISEVEAETGRGLGTGYLLTGLRPEVEGYIFKGWATSADSTETVEAIDLTADTTLYAVWEDNENYNTAEMLEETEIKGTGSKNGIRFKSVISNAEKANLAEFGFIATREVLLPKVDENYDYEALTFAHKVRGEDKCYYATGVAYDKDEGIDIINSENEDGSIVYTAVISGIPLASKKETMVVRPYAKYEINGKAVTFYGEAATGSLYGAADSIKKTGGEMYENNKTYIDSILAE